MLTDTAQTEMDDCSYTTENESETTSLKETMIYTTCYTKEIKQDNIDSTKEAWLNEQCQLIEQLDAAHRN